MQTETRNIHLDVARIVGAALNCSDAGIYQILLIDSERSYIGRSKCVGGRLFDHAKDLLLNKHPNPKLQRAWNKYGEASFRFHVLEKVGRDGIAKAEQKWIDHFQAASLGFNILTTADPYTGLDPKDPNVKQYRHALEAVDLALKIVQCGRLHLASLQDCLRWNAYALEQLDQIPAAMVQQERARGRLAKAVSYANGPLAATRDTACQALAETVTLGEAQQWYVSLLHKPWQQAVMTWTIEQANQMLGTKRVKKLRSDSLQRMKKLDLPASPYADDHFLDACHALGVRQPTADELRAAGLITWENN